jgi:hypothetical protein
MMQLFCPSCENVVEVNSSDPDEVLPCPECRQPIYWLGRRKARPVNEPEAVAPALPPEVDQRLVAVPPRPPARSLVPAASTPVSVPPDEETSVPEEGPASWEGGEEQDFSLPVPEPTPVFVGLPYRPEGGVRPARLPLFILAVWSAGVGLGLLASFLGQFCYLVLLYPLALGLALAGFTVLAGHLAHVRSPMLAGLVALAGGLLALGAMHLSDYQRMLDVAEMEPFRLPAAMASRLRESADFLDYLRATADVGLTISGRDSGGLELGSTAAWAYWGVEAVLVVVIAVLGGAAAAREPFCSDCRVWKEDRFLGTLHDGAELRANLRKGRLGAMECFRPSDLLAGELVLTVSVCPRCGPASPIDLRLERNPRARAEPDPASLPLRLTLPGEALPVLEQALASPAA